LRHQAGRAGSRQTGGRQQATHACSPSASHVSSSSPLDGNPGAAAGPASLRRWLALWRLSDRLMHNRQGCHHFCLLAPSNTHTENRTDRVQGLRAGEGFCYVSLQTSLESMQVNRKHQQATACTWHAAQHVQGRQVQVPSAQKAACLPACQPLHAGQAALVAMAAWLAGQLEWRLAGSLAPCSVSSAGRLPRLAAAAAAEHGYCWAAWSAASKWHAALWPPCFQSSILHAWQQ